MGEPLPISYNEAYAEMQIARLGGPEEWRNFPWSIGPVMRSGGHVADPAEEGEPPAHP